MITSCAGSGSGIDGIDGIDDIDGFGGSGTPGSTTPSSDRDSPAQDTPGSTKGGGGLSEGAKGGIAGGVVGAALLLFLVLFFVFRRRRAAKKSALVAESSDILGADTAGKRDTPGPAKLGVEQLDTQNRGTRWEELAGKEISTDASSSARGHGSIVELGPNPPRPIGTLPGQQSLGYSSVVTELESGSRATELEGAGAPIASQQSAGGVHTGGTRAIPDSEGLIPVGSTVDPAEASSSGVRPFVAASQVQTQVPPRPLSGEDLDQLLRLDEELEERRRTLEEIKEVQSRQAAIREKIKGMQAQ